MKRYFPWCVSRAVSAAVPVAAGASWKLNPGSTIHVPSSFFPAFLLPSCIRLKEEVKCAHLGHHSKDVCLAYPERKGCWRGSFSTFFHFSTPFFLGTRGFPLIFWAEVYGISPNTAWWHKSQFKRKGWSQRLVLSYNFIISEDFSSIVYLSKCHCGLISVLSGGSPKHSF